MLDKISGGDNMTGKDVVLGVLCISLALMAFEHHSILAGIGSVLCLLELL